MPVFNFFHYAEGAGHTLEKSGPIIPVTIGIPVALEEFCAAKGFQIPAPVAGYALIDTGASASAVHEQILLDMGVLPIDSIPTQTPHGDGRSFVYPAKVGFPAFNIDNYRMDRLIGSQLKWKVDDEKEVIMLLGRDILKYMLFVYNGLSSDVHIAF
jgi:hypothetical protein